MFDQNDDSLALMQSRELLSCKDALGCKNKQEAVLTALLGPYLAVCLVIVFKLTETTSASSKGQHLKLIETSATHQGPQAKNIPYQPFKTSVDQTRIQLTCQRRKNSFFRSHLFTTNRVPYKLACIKLVSFKAVINRNNKLANLLFN